MQPNNNQPNQQPDQDETGSLNPYGVPTESPTDLRSSVPTLVGQPLPSTVADIDKDGLPGLPPVLPPAKKKSRYTLVALIVLIAMLVGGYYLYVMLNDSPQQSSEGNSIQLDDQAVSNSDTLVAATIKNTTYLRPSSWTLINENQGSYGYNKNGENTWEGLLIIGEYDQQKDLIGASDDVYESLREKVNTSPISSGYAQSFLERTGKKCGTSESIDNRIDTTSTDTAVGLYIVVAQCEDGDGGVTLKERTVIGRDGIKRAIILIAFDELWTTNGDDFEKILNSVGGGV